MYMGFFNLLKAIPVSRPILMETEKVFNATVSVPLLFLAFLLVLKNLQLIPPFISPAVYAQVGTHSPVRGELTKENDLRPPRDS